MEDKGKLTWSGEELFSEEPLRCGSSADSKRPVNPSPEAPFALRSQETGAVQAPGPGDDDEAASRGARISYTSKEPRSRKRFSWQAPSPVADTKPSNEALEGSKSEQHIRVATALDRIGAGIVEVRKAFQRQLPLRRQAMDVKQDATRTPISRRRDTQNENPEEDVAHESVVEEAMVRSMMDLRLPLEIAKKCCDGIGAASVAKGTPTFSEFVERYAIGAGLLEEPLDGERGQLWAEGPGGIWMAVSPERLARARAAFDDQGTTREGDAKSNDTEGKFHHFDT